MPRGRRVRCLLALALALALALVPACAAPVRGDSGEPRTLATLETQVFAPGVVSGGEADLFRGQFAEDGEAFYFFRKLTPDREDYRILVTRRLREGWGPAQQLDLGGDSSDFYPTVAPDGRALVFSSYRPVPGDDPETANANLWVAPREGDRWGRPQLLAISTLENYDAGPRFDARGDLVWISVSPDWSRRFPRRAAWRDGGPSEPVPNAVVERWRDFDPDLYVWDGIEDPLRRFVILGVSSTDPETGWKRPSDLWIVPRDGDGWAEPRDLGPVINTEEDETFMLFTPDGGQLLFCRGFRTYLAVPVAEILAALDAPGPAGK